MVIFRRAPVKKDYWNYHLINITWESKEDIAKFRNASKETFKILFTSNLAWVDRSVRVRPKVIKINYRKSHSSYSMKRIDLIVRVPLPGLKLGENLNECLNNSSLCSWLCQTNILVLSQMYAAYIVQNKIIFQVDFFSFTRVESYKNMLKVISAKEPLHLVSQRN